MTILSENSLIMIYYIILLSSLVRVNIRNCFDICKKKQKKMLKCTLFCIFHTTDYILLTFMCIFAQNFKICCKFNINFLNIQILLTKIFFIMWNLINVNYICRIITDKEGKFKFDVLLRSEVLITNGKSYETFEEASKELCLYLNKMYEYDRSPNIDGNKHLIVDQTIFE